MYWVGMNADDEGVLRDDCLAWCREHLNWNFRGRVEVDGGNPVLVTEDGAEGTSS